MAKKYNKQTLDRLNADAEFQKIVSSDPVLVELMSRRVDEAERVSELSLYLGANVMLCGTVPVAPPAAWYFAFLDLMRSPFLSSGEVRSIDVDVAVRGLIERTPENFKSLDPADIRKTSSGTCERLGIDMVDACADIREIITKSVVAYQQLPQVETGKKATFSAGWLTQIVSRAFKVCGYSWESVMFEVPFCRTAYLVVQYAAEQGTPIAERQTVSGRVMQRLNTLMDERVASYG